MLLVASALALLVGVSLGMMGGGGSILTLPILRYVLGLPAHDAIGVSMLVVGATSVAALVPHARRKRVQWRIGLVFGVAGMIGAYLTGRFTHLIPGVALLSGFALMMFATAFAMLRKTKLAPPMPAEPARTRSWTKLIAEGFAVGAVSGLLGAGGGFVIVPALVLLAKLPMDVAVGTSLVVIAMNMAAGFVGVVGEVSVDAHIAGIVSVAAVAGSLIGGKLSARVSPAALRTGFGWFVIAMAFFILAQELPPLFGFAQSPGIASAVAACATLVLALGARLNLQHGRPRTLRPG